ncbi:hypothetical protein PFISCL1PPCAC_17075 [Pristionchus fissidentatus]|uniref:JmjC domain-containing protein n=1 Tax=Pristionchus fissidentatus TaxID=1538716 RepID=A0AAV5W4Y0_9BILA|nr:hypothetical protein PFISCL1PPCAC_17075 [Pristionchus fissidentatus]
MEEYAERRERGLKRKKAASKVDDAKKNARPELNNFGWQTLGYAAKFKFPPVVDTIQRDDATTLSVEEFREKYEIPGVPCILRNCARDWQANEKWTVERLGRKYRNQKFKCGEDDEGYSVKMKMKYYMDYLHNNTDDSPLYIFDSSFGDRHKTKQLLEDFTVPPYFEDDLFRYAEYKKRPPHRWFVMGPARSGTAIHIDPLGTSAWNTLITGYKRWVLIPPGAPKPLVKPYKHEAGKHPDEAVTWFTYVYPRVKAASWPRDYPIIEARQGPGETMFVPSGWWHVVINECATMAITQNFASLANLRAVWPKTVKGRPKLSKHWFKRLSVARPEVLPILAESAPIRTANEEDSSDSSSSSSSSSSSDEGEESEMEEIARKCGVSMRKKRRLDDNSKERSDSPCVNKIRKSEERK